jgi:hypothetical protein
VNSCAAVLEGESSPQLLLTFARLPLAVNPLEATPALNAVDEIKAFVSTNYGIFLSENRWHNRARAKPFFKL